MWKVNPRHKGNKIALPNREIELDSISSPEIEHLLKFYPNLKAFFIKVDEKPAAVEEPEADEPAELSEAEERAILSARFEELRGRRPAHNMRLENLRNAVEEAENEKA